MLRRLAVLINCCIFSFSLSAKQPVLVGLTHIPKVMDYGVSNAPYNKLIKKIRKDLPVNVEFQYMPSERGTRLLSAGKIDCIFPIIPGNYPRKEKTKFSSPINGIALHLFALDKQYQSLNQLEHQVVVYLRGYLFANYVENFPNVNFFPTSNQANALQMLMSGRASAYIDYIPDVRFSLPTREFVKLKFDKYHPLLKNSDRFECKEDGLPGTFLQHVETVIKDLQKTGEIKRVLGAYYAPFN